MVEGCNTIFLYTVHKYVRTICIINDFDKLLYVAVIFYIVESNHIFCSLVKSSVDLKRVYFV